MVCPEALVVQPAGDIQPIRYCRINESGVHQSGWTEVELTEAEAEAYAELVAAVMAFRADVIARAAGE